MCGDTSALWQGHSAVFMRRRHISYTQEKWQTADADIELSSDDVLKKRSGRAEAEGESDSSGKGRQLA